MRLLVYIIIGLLLWNFPILLVIPAAILVVKMGVDIAIWNATDGPNDRYIYRK